MVRWGGGLVVTREGGGGGGGGDLRIRAAFHIMTP